MKYNYFQDEKLEYEDIEVPEELLFMVRRTVAADRRKKAARKRMRILKMAGSAAAVLFMCLTIGVNSSYAFAETAVKIPIVKGVAKAVVIRSYRPEIIAVYEQSLVSNLSKTTVEETPETQPEEILPAESDNDVVIQEVATEPPAEQAPEKALTGLDAWKAEMTLEKLRQVTEVYTPDMEEQYADTPEKLRTILLAELPEKDVSLYGYHEDGKVTGTVLRIGNTYQYFDWNYMNESRKLPDLFWDDINGDGKEEVTVLLYNGKLQKKEISKEDIEVPGEEETGAAPEETTGEEIPSVSGNDTEAPAESKKDAGQPAGELWVVCPRGENWSASVLSVNDYESQILHRLNAEYDERKGTVQLYLVEEPFGEPVKLSIEQQDGLVYEAINLAPAKRFIVEKGIVLQFQMEVSFLKADGEKISVLLEPELETEITLEEGSFVTGEIKEQATTAH